MHLFWLLLVHMLIPELIAVVTIERHFIENQKTHKLQVDLVPQTAATRSGRK